MTSETELNDAVKALSNSLKDINNSNSSTHSSTCTLDKKADGAIILGTDIKRGNRYVTRYRIDRNKQREAVRSSVRMKECFPCLVPRKRSPWKHVWDVLRGEAFLLSLHVLVIALASVKEALDYEVVAEDLHLLHSVLETVLTIIIVIIRVVSAKHGYSEIVEIRQKTEVWHHNRDPTAEALGRYVNFFIALVVTLAVLDVIALLILIFLEEDLAWTIITNNAVLVIIMGYGGQIQGMVKNEMNTLRNDQNKAVIYESILLMSECIQAEDKESKAHAYTKAEHFCRALKDTELLQLPEYVTFDSDESTADLVTSMQVVSMM